MSARALGWAEASARAGALPLALLLALAGAALSPGAADAPPPLEAVAPLGLGSAEAAALQGLLVAALALLLVVPAGGRAEEDAFLERVPLDPARAGRVRLAICLAVLLAALVVRALAATLLWGGERAPLVEAVARFPRAALQAGVFLAFAALLAPWGRLAWIGLGLPLLLLRTGEGPDLLGLAGPAGGGPLALIGGSAAGLLALFAADARFARGADAPPRVAALFSGRRGRRLARLASFAAAVVGAGLPLVVVRGGGSSRAAELAAPTERRVVALTRRVRLEGPARALGRVRALAAGADATVARVTSLLGADPPRERLELDVGRGPPDERPGRVAVDAAPGSARRALARETARRLLGERIPERMEGGGPASAEVLVAGAVRYATWRATGTDPFWSRFHAAVAHARRVLEPEEAFDVARLRRTRGLDLAPALGEVLVAGLVRRYGDAALPRVLDALAAASRRPRGVRGWRILLARLGYELEDVFESLLVITEGVARDPRARVPLPRLTVVEDPQASDPFNLRRLRLLAVPDRDVPEGWRVACRVRYRGHDLEPRPAVRLGKTRAGSYAFTAPGGGIRVRRRPQVQAGLVPARPRPFAEPIWEEWASRR